MHVMIIGGSGMLGGELIRQAQRSGNRVTASYYSRRPVDDTVDWHQLDTRNPQQTRKLIAVLAPDVVINASFHQHDWASTADGAAHVAGASVTTGSRLVQVSSDAIFSGDADSYPETALPDPTTPYGAAKAAAETAIKVIDPTAIIARTSLIIGSRSSHERLVHALAGGAGGQLFTDDVRCPVALDDLAAALLELGFSDRTGVHHVAGSDAISRYELGILIARRDGLDPESLPSGSRRESGIPGPIDVRLDSSWTQRQLRTRLRGAKEFLRAAAQPTRAGTPRTRRPSPR